MLRRVLVIVLPLFVWSACGSNTTGPDKPCTYTLSASAVTAPTNGTSSSVTVTKSSGSGCSWTAAADVNWINVAPTSSSSDSTTLNFTVAQNVTTDTRVGHIGVSWNGGSGSLAITQQGGTPPSCTYAVGDSSISSFPSGGGTGQIPITVDGTGCSAWSATTTVGWIHITSGASGTTTGAIVFTVDPSGSSRNDKITVTYPGGSKAVVVVQGGPTGPNIAANFTFSPNPCTITGPSATVNCTVDGSSSTGTISQYTWTYLSTTATGVTHQLQLGCGIGPAQQVNVPVTLTVTGSGGSASVTKSVPVAKIGACGF